jgi:beta-alanine--pyruvate transaminase
MGGVVARGDIYDAFMTGPESVIEFFHGYTYSGHPLAVAAGHASLDAMINERLIERAAELSGVLQDAVHTLRDEPHVADIRNIGLAAAVELEPFPGQPGARGQRAFSRGLDEGILLRLMGDIIGLAPPFISTEDEIRSMIESLRRTLRAIAAD